MTATFDNSYARLPKRFFARLHPDRPSAPQLVRLNRVLAETLGIDAGWLGNSDGVAMLSGKAMPAGADPIAMAYAGHQFGGFSPQLGDGRAHLLGEMVGRDGVRRDVQLKGSGRTPFSRQGDGRAALGPVLREYIVAEAMAALGIPTTRALAAVRTGETVMREAPLPGAVLTRVARSHVRVGTFQYFAVRKDWDALRVLIAYVIERHYPDAAKAKRPALALLDAVIDAQADLIASWMAIGFIHGVMNTDNMSVAGETIDYGPCAFMDAHHNETVYSSIDQGGRYAYGNQPGIAQWNLVRLAESLLSAIDPNRETAISLAQAAIDRFPDRYHAAWLRAFRKKLGLTKLDAADRTLAENLLGLMQAGQADFTLTFRRLAACADDPSRDAALRALFKDGAQIAEWLSGWRSRLAQEGRAPGACRAQMNTANPAIIPRNHLVEEALSAAVSGNETPFHQLVDALQHPFDAIFETHRYAQPPKPGEEVRATFCGT
ncbi:MAG: YdiU family protein [Pseudomonadota bacterium]